MQNLLPCDVVSKFLLIFPNKKLNFVQFFSAQKAGFLSEPRHDEVDPYYAHCKSHSDKTQIKNRKRNYNALLVQIKHHETVRQEMLGSSEKSTPEQERIERKLKKHRIKYTSNKLTRTEPWGKNSWNYRMNSLE